MNFTEPQSVRANQMKIYNQLVSDLDSGGAHYSQSISEVDLSDPEDVKVLADDSHGEVLVHLGSSDFLDRYKLYVGHVQEWRQQFARLDSVDLRYEHQIVVNPDLQGAMKQSPLSPSAVRTAMQAGVKPAALLIPEPVKTGSSTPTPPAARQKLAKPRRRKAVARKTFPATKPTLASASIGAKQSTPQPSAQKAVSPTTQGNQTTPGKPSPAISQGQPQ
jgi:cell division protein FtsQ